MRFLFALVHPKADPGGREPEVGQDVLRGGADANGVAARRAWLLVVNLPPRKMARILSEGMLFDIGYSDGIAPVLAVPEHMEEKQQRGRQNRETDRQRT